jgi:tungstate transport system substrate-binding protein
MFCARHTPRTLDIATTTSVVNSGLLSTLLPLFEAETGVTVRVHAAGSGRALEMLHDQVVELVISHAPNLEAQMLKSHPDWRYQKIASNRFLVVGPPGDPADVRGATDAVSAFARIAGANADFLSRGDGSGTHERELLLWDLAKVKPAEGHLLVSGSGMAATLRQADEQEAYTLTDDATFSQLRDRLTLQSLFSNDRRLVNSYAVVHPRESVAAAQFAEWLVHGNGRAALAAYKVGGTQPFHAWPAACRNDEPLAELCDSKTQ